MCGILGLVYNPNSKIPPGLLSRTIENLYKLSETRGKEASGISYIEQGTIKVIKQNTSASQLLRNRTFKKSLSQYIEKISTNEENVFSLIGHSRLVTNGDSSLHFNNQPVIANGMVAVHNGIVVNDAELWQKYPDLERHYQVDTEIILNLIRHFRKQGNSLTRATQLAFGEIKGATSIAAQFDDLNCLLLATNNGSVYLGYSKHLIFFASEEFIIKSTLQRYPELQSKSGEFKVYQVEPGNGLTIDLKTLEKTEFKLAGGELVPEKIAASERKSERKILDLFGSRNIQSIPAVTIPSVPREFESFFEERHTQIMSLRRCTRCVLPSTMPFISFDGNGVCSYCNNYQPIELRGKEALENELGKYTAANGRYNCIVSLSGGRDSSYGLHYITEVMGMKPITYTYDWGMVTDLARRNISRLCGKLGIEHILISADIRKKRANIRRNVSAWLKKPDLGMIPLFMAGDKQFFYHGDRLKKQLGIDLTILSENLLEKTSFKTGFCGIGPVAKSDNTYTLPGTNKIKLAAYYLRNYLQNPAYINLSLIDTFLAFCTYYVMNHNFLFLYQYIPWNEREIEDILINNYEWELAPDCSTTWRIGDGTAAFYNYIYYMVAGFTENDTFRSNQIREGHITREEALNRIIIDNRPRWPSIRWYCETIDIPFESTVRRINSIQPRLPVNA